MTKGKFKKKMSDNKIEDIKITETFYFDDYQNDNNITFSEKEKAVYFTLLHKAGDNQFQPFKFALQQSKHYLKNITQQEFNQISQKLKQHKIIDFSIPINKNDTTLYKLNLFAQRTDL